MMKVMTIVGTRPEIIKLSRVIAELDRYTEHVLVHTGQNFDYELNGVFFDGLGIRKPDHFLEVVGSSTAQTIGNVIAKADEVLRLVGPDALLLYGDTNSCLAVIAAKRLKIPVFHMEAGNRCFDQRVPEELNRKVVDHLSDVNLTLTEHARRYLLAEGVRPELVIKVGSSLPEIFTFHSEAIAASDVLSRMGLNLGGYFVVSAHREENVDSERNFADLLRSVNRLAVDFDKRVIVSTHPRTRARLNALPGLEMDPRVEFLSPLGFIEYARLQQDAFCVVSDSGTVTEEASILGFPAVTIREAHERPEGMDAGVLVMSGLRPDNVSDAVRVVTDQWAKRPGARAVADYGTDGVAERVVRIVLSYTEYVNRVIWKK